MKGLKDINDDQIRIVGHGTPQGVMSTRTRMGIYAALGVLMISLAVVAVVWYRHAANQALMAPEPALFEPEGKGIRE